jgi:hypothetical protein
MKISHKTIQSHIVEELPKTSVVADKLVFHAFEVESFEETADDAIYDIQPLPDRANDCKTDYGIAREVANLFGLTLKVPSEYSVDGNENTTVDFTPADISKYLGYEITLDQIKSVLDQFHYQYSVDGQAVAASDVIVFQFPFYWHAAPALLKEWQDKVLGLSWSSKQLGGEAGRNADTCPCRHCSGHHQRRQRLVRDPARP